MTLHQSKLAPIEIHDGHLRWTVSLSIVPESRKVALGSEDTLWLDSATVILNDKKVHDMIKCFPIVLVVTRHVGTCKR